MDGPANRSDELETLEEGLIELPRPRRSPDRGPPGHEERQVADDAGKLRDRSVRERPGRFLEEAGEVDLGGENGRDLDRRGGERRPGASGQMSDRLALDQERPGRGRPRKRVVPFLERGRIEAERLEDGFDGALDDIKIRFHSGRAEARAGQEAGRNEAEVEVLAVLSSSPQ